jgi:hypothetical protein
MRTCRAQPVSSHEMPGRATSASSASRAHSTASQPGCGDPCPSARMPRSRTSQYWENRLLGFAPLNEAGMGWIWACLAPERCLYGNLRVRRSSHRQRSGTLWAYTIRVEPGGPDASASGWRRGLCAWMTFTLHNRALPPRPEGAKDWFKPLRSRADSRHVGCAPQRQMTHPLRLFTLAVVDVAGYSYTMARGCIRRHDNCLRN